MKLNDVNIDISLLLSSFTLISSYLFNIVEIILVLIGVKFITISSGLN